MKTLTPKTVLWLLALLSSLHAVAHAASPLPIKYSLARIARVSLNVYDANGKIVREVLHAQPQNAGAHSIAWDGRDDAGKVLPAGKYAWKILGVPGFGTEYITALGSNYAEDENGPWWALGPGCHGGPSAIAVGDDGFYVGAFSENIETTILKQSLNGSTRAWSGTAPAAWEGFTAMSIGRGQLWGYAGNGKIYRYDLKTGAKSEAIFGVALGDENPTDFCVTDKSILAAYPKAGKVRWLDDAGKETRSVALPGASTVDVARDGTAYVLAGTSLWKIAPDATEAQVLVKDLVAPRRAAVNGSNGEIYIIEGELSNQVKRFDASGKLLSTYGKKGGRVDGLYQNQRESFRGAKDIAVEPNGNFWVAEGEAAPRRVAKFDIEGKLHGEWYGGQVWAPWVAPEPDNPRFVWMASHWGDIMRLEVDYTKKSWKVDATYHIVGMADGLILNHDNGEDWKARVHNGTLYLCRASSGCPVVLKVDRATSKLVPVAVTVGSFWHDASLLPQWAKDKAAGAQSLLWTDANGDGRPLNADGSPQTDELKFFTPPATYAVNSGVDSNLNYITAGGKTQFSVSGWNAEGAPLYTDFPAGTDAIGGPPIPLGTYDDRWSTYVTRDDKGDVWSGFNTDVTGWGNSKGAYLARWNANKTLAWTVGRTGSTPGSLKTLRHIYGVVNNCVVIGAFSYEWPADGPTPTYVFDRDGLYAGQIFSKPLNTQVANWRYGLGGEALSGDVVKTSPDEVLFFGTWINEARIYRITGWDKWQRASGTIAIPANYDAPPAISETFGTSGKGTGLKGEYWANTQADCWVGNWKGVPTVTRLDPIPRKPDGTAASTGFEYDWRGARTATPTDATNNLVAAPGIDYDWGGGGGAYRPPMDSQFYSVRLTGFVTPRRTGWHMFQNLSGLRFTLWANGITVDGPGHGPFGTSGRALWLEAGKAYPLKLEGWHYPNQDHKGLSLQWSEPESNGTFALIPTSQLTPAPMASSASSSTPAAPDTTTP